MSKLEEAQKENAARLATMRKSAEEAGARERRASFMTAALVAKLRHTGNLEQVTLAKVVDEIHRAFDLVEDVRSGAFTPAPRSSTETHAGHTQGVELAVPLDARSKATLAGLPPEVQAMARDVIGDTKK